ncbi:MAG: sugar ABC transporter substrate-binding protein [Candidatus Moranbacteria bacterium]|nr:sugar ABC transporter substrate-binding protein [Candidatus Moranbacteria bacterium]
MKKIRTAGKAFIAVFLLFSLSGCGFKDTNEDAYKVDLEVWGVFDDSDAYAEIFAEYQKINPFIGEIRYRKLQPENYQTELLNALAANKGPDIFMLRNAWVPGFADKIEPAPENYSEKNYREAFVDVVAADFIGEDKKIYGAPLSVDSLGLYYNKDLFNAAGIAKPPATWEELAADAALLSKLDANGAFEQSGAALGTATNINRSTDILTAMMFQLGAEFNGNQASISLSDEKNRKALEFYTQFANIRSPQYSWNASQHYSIDAFYEGRLAMMINYSWQYATLKQKNAKLNIGVAPLPQFIGGKPSNVSNYWGYAVTKNKEYVPKTSETVQLSEDNRNKVRKHEAWELLRYMTYPHPEKKITLENGLSKTTKEFPLTIDPALKYLEKTHKPAARRDLIEVQQEDVTLGPFASGNLLAGHWQQVDVDKTETILADMIEAVVRGERSLYDALSTATNRLRVLAR